ncbi:MAG TPA: penicillin-binding protein 2 [Bacillota bacterium]|nr:penicillin-binding protein 2 [Bacillota bacterium]HPU95680.1 penicillin-binding protein 2 [Bacillota bacterium]
MGIRVRDRNMLENRTRTILWIVGAMIVLMLSRLWYLQVIKGRYYMERAEQNRLAKVYLTAPRGEILDRNGAVLATNRTAYSISVVPKDVKDKEAVLSLLAKLTGIKREDLAAKYAEHTKGRFSQPYRPLKLVADADPKILAAIAERRYELEGVTIDEEPYRTYPFGSVAGNLMGYMGQVNADELRQLGSQGYRASSQIGKAGIERGMESYLHGTDGVNRIEVDSSASPVSMLAAIDPVPGNSVVLTIDAGLQKEAEKLLKDGIAAVRQAGKYAKVKSGSLVAMDPRNGEVLAMASYPGYDPSIFIPSITEKDWNKLNSSPSSIFNRAISGAYPPGSTFKAIVTAAALEAGVVNPNEKILCSPSVADKYYGMRCMSWASGTSHGYVDLYTAIATSCNIYFYEMGKRLTVDKLAEMSRAFGLGSKTGFELAVVENAGKVQSSADRKFMPGEKLSYTIGQMVTVTPLQMARVYSAIATRGVLSEPTLLREVVGPDGRRIGTVAKPEPERVELSASTWDVITKGMRMTVTKGTAARAFAGFPIPTSGKTGTAQAPPNDSHAWFACWAPSDDPEIVVVVMLENGGGGGGSSAPIARDLLEYYFKVGDYAVPEVLPEEMPEGL